MSSLNFKKLGLSPMLLSALEKLGYTHPTDIQAQAIPHLLDGHDLLGTAQTGTGKTASFVLPLLHRLSESDSRPASRGPRRALHPSRPYRPEALILAPTRELAIQIGESIQGYGQGTGLTHQVIFGGAPKGGQLQKMAYHPPILVATPGRLLDFIQEGVLDITAVQYLILDEADRMLDMGFIPDVKKISAMTKNRKQTLLFSATMPGPIEALAASLLRSPKRVAIAPQEIAVTRIRQSVLHLEQGDKIKLLPELIKDRSMFRVIVFTRTKHRASRVSKILAKAGIPSDALHGDRSQNQRQRALESFRKGKIQALVATDVAARGIDVDDVTHVINFEIPHESESYVHRIGRTARAGQDGDAISFCDPQELEDLWAIEKLLGEKVPMDIDHPYHHQPRSRPEARKPGARNQGSRPQGAAPQGQRNRSGAKKAFGSNSSQSRNQNQGSFSPRSQNNRRTSPSNRAY